MTTNNILIVDDMPENLQLLLNMLHAHGYKARAFAEGSFALESARANPPDLVLLDVRMPGMDGYTVCEHLKADPRTCDIPVMFISAHGETDDKIRGFRVGGVDYITKPFQVEEVLARIQTHLQLRTAQLELQREVQRRSQAEEDLQALNQQLREANQRLEDTNASKDTFFSLLAHDLRNPFTVLLGLTDVLNEELEHYSQDQLRAAIQRLHRSSKNVYALLTNLLEWSRLERGLLTCEPHAFAVDEAVRRNIQLFSSQAQQKGIHVNCHVPAGTLVHADAKMIETVVRNLLSNALKFTESDGTVEITTQENDHNIELVVSDTGIGMSQDVLDKLFRIDQKTLQPGTAGEEGTGLGLILCNTFVEKNGGNLRIESAVGQGSRVIVSLPAQGSPLSYAQGIDDSRRK
jgi:two-component system, sensor histidine kinase and response regulator